MRKQGRSESGRRGGERLLAERGKEFFREIGRKGAASGKLKVSREQRQEAGRRGAAKIHAERRQAKEVLAALEPFRVWLESTREELRRMLLQDAGAADVPRLFLPKPLPPVTYGDCARLLSAMENFRVSAAGVMAHAESIVAAAARDLRGPVPSIDPVSRDDAYLSANTNAPEGSR